MYDTYVSIDLETTGLNPKRDRIIEIGAIRVEQGQIAEEFSTFVDPGRKLEERITELTGICLLYTSSILSHDHFQGGHYEFAMAKAPVERTFSVAGFEDVDAGIVAWPMSVIRLSGTDTDRIIALADVILNKWREYTDEEAFIYAYTDNEPHNTITPIARKRGDKFELDLVLRNNITTEEHPLGVYHPHAKLHHIKKENIGLIEVMGLAVLPARLKGCLLYTSIV